MGQIGQSAFPISFRKDGTANWRRMVRFCKKLWRNPTNHSRVSENPPVADHKNCYSPPYFRPLVELLPSWLNMGQIRNLYPRLAFWRGRFEMATGGPRIEDTVAKSYLIHHRTRRPSFGP